ncbi:MAG TPA: site-2 protease family protein [Verrucomicrobiae bacterium]|jgi:Zn-dependent protease|nr:site-2 protease family protein [Verrucomicrobiae bacterium]
MPTGRQGSIHLFKFQGVDVFLHWSWFLVAVFIIKGQFGVYSSIGWSILEYVALFLIVLTHEFGHSLACRSVGGNADRIVLWPLGGVAYVDPPPRPGATLWSIAAGPLVNVALLPILWGLHSVSRSQDWAGTQPDLALFIFNVAWINTGLLLFNILPIFPLDGGQILRSLLWFIIGRARSLLVATVIGFIGVALFIFYAVRTGSAWLGILAVFMLLNCWTGLKHAMQLIKMSKLPRRGDFSCPTCKSSPPIGEFWACGNCRHRFDTFASGATCPYCGTQYPVTRCFDCGRAHAMNEWTKFAPQSNATLVGGKAEIR